MNTTDTARMVGAALEGNYGLWVDTDMGDVDLFGDDLEQAWDDLAPGEAFKILGVILDNERKEI